MKEQWIKDKIDEYFRSYRVPFNNGMKEGLKKVIEDTLEVWGKCHIIPEDDGNCIVDANGYCVECRKEGRC